METKRHLRVAIFANGELHEEFLEEITPDIYIIGVDGGALWLLKHGRNVDLAVGDFDSVNSEELKLIKSKIKSIKIYHQEKDYTDTHLALQLAINLHPSLITIFGAIGTRLDHTLSNICLLKLCLENNISAVIKNIQNEIRLIDSDVTVFKTDKYKYLSLIPFTKKTIVSISGVKYPLEKRLIQQEGTIGISNEIIGKSASIKVDKGSLLVILSRD